MFNTETYSDLLNEIFREKIAIRLWPAADPFKYCPNGIYGKNENQPVILVPRSVNGTWINPGATPLQVSAFIGSASEAETEMIYVAHEFGHHFSGFSDCEQVREDFDADPQSASFEDRQKLYDEEVSAWNKARTTMKTLCFDNWTLFNRLEFGALDGYRKGYRL